MCQKRKKVSKSFKERAKKGQAQYRKLYLIFIIIIFFLWETLLNFLTGRDPFGQFKLARASLPAGTIKKSMKQVEEKNE